MMSQGMWILDVSPRRRITILFQFLRRKKIYNDSRRSPETGKK
jgi:hypothetical protein